MPVTGSGEKVECQWVVGRGKYFFDRLDVCDTYTRVWLSHVQLFVILWTIAHQAPLSMGISSKNIEVGYCALLHGIFPIQGSNLNLLCVLHCRWFLYPLSHWGMCWGQDAMHFSKSTNLYTRKSGFHCAQIL